jgi:hypothetical protein
MVVPVMTTSERRSLKRCPQRWSWAFVDGLKPRQENVKLWFGGGIHIALAHRYGPGQLRRRDFIDKWEAFCDEDEMSRTIKTYDEASEARWYEARDLGIGMLLGYQDNYGRDRDWDVVYVEEPIKVRIPHPDDPKRTVGVFLTTIDGVVWDRVEKRFKLIEHKTANAIQTQHLDKDEQAGAMWALANDALRAKGILDRRERIMGIEYNFLRKALPPTDRPRNRAGLYLNKNGSISKSQPAPFFHREFVERTRVENLTQVRRLGHDFQLMRAFRTGIVPLVKNPTRDCFWDCDFATMCKLHEEGADWEGYRDSLFRVGDPHYMYRKTTEE